jgi:hypothetical protein
MFTVRFQVKKGGFLDIDLIITNPNDKVSVCVLVDCTSAVRENRGGGGGFIKKKTTTGKNR